MIDSQDEFFRWENDSRDVIDFKRIYADMAGGEALLGLVLSEIVFWHLPSKEGENKLRALQEGEYWVVRARHEWWDRIRISPKQADRALSALEQQGLIIKALFKWRGVPTVHVRINWPTFLERLNDAHNNPPSNPYKPDDDGDGQGVKSISTKGKNPFLPKGKMDFDERGKSITENTIKRLSHREYQRFPH